MTQLNIPYQFVAGTKAKASEVNANFTAVANEIDEVYAQISENETNHTSAHATMTTNISNLTTRINNFTEQYSQVMKFCINSGKLNSSNKPAILSYEANIISFDVSSETPIQATNINGHNFSATSISDLTLPTLTDGTYTIYLNTDGTVSYYTSTAQYVDALPSSPYVNEVCVITSCEPVKAYIYSNSSWSEFTSVPMGEFTIASSAISSIKTYAYNQNGYDLSIKSFEQNFADNGWVKLPNNLILQWGKYEFSANEIISFPITFPTKCLGIVAGDNYNAIAASGHVNVTVVSTSQFQIAESMYSSGSISGAAYVFAYGY